MKILTNKKLIFFSCLCYIILIAFRVNNPPDGVTGAPGENTCAQCHGGGNPNIDGEVVMTGIPGTIESNTLYTITVTVTNPNGNGARGGFQMVSLDSNDNNSGTLSNPGASSAIDPDGNRNYFEHRPAQSFGAGTEVSYTVDWMAPEGPNNELITFYAAGNIANGNGSTSLDRIVTSQISGSLSAPADPLEVNILNVTGVSCNGGSDGSGEAVVTGGTPPFSFLWDNSEDTQIATMLAAGNRSVTVTDNASVTASATTVISQPQPLTLDILLETDALCNGESNGSATVEGDGGTPGYIYIWSNGGSENSQDNLAAGSYVVTVTDANECSSTNLVNIGEPDILALDIILVQNVSCNGEDDGLASVGGSGGTGPYSFEWPDGDMNATRLDLTAGTYLVTVTDFNNCIATNIIQVQEPDLLVANASATDESTPGAMDGIATANPIGGTMSYFYTWTTGEDTQTIMNLAPGDYSVTVTDQNGCLSIETVTVGGTDCNLTISIENDSLSCNGDADGLLIVNISGQTDPVTIDWSSGGSTDTITNLIAGTYTVTVTDANSCTAIDSGIVVEPSILEITFDTVIAVTCFGDSNGQIQVTVMGGTAPYSYGWSNGADTEDLINLEAGFYELTVTDANGCQSSACDEISQPDQLAANTSATNESAPDANDGTASANPSGGTPPYNYIWSNDSTTQNISGLSPGNYNVTITDENQCSVEENVIVGTEGCPLQVSASTTNVLCHGDSTGMINLTLMNEVDPVSFLWSTGDTTQNLAGIPAGAYSVTVSDQSNCVVNLDTTITEPEAIELAITILMNPDCPDSANGSLLATTNATGAAFQWSNGTMTPQIDDLSAGEYCITLTDQNECTASACIELLALDTFPPMLTVMDISVYVDESGNVDEIKFEEFDNGSTDNCSMLSLVEPLDTLSCSNLGLNNVAFTVTDSSGNTASDIVNITVIDTVPPKISLQSMEIYADGGGNFSSLSFSDVDSGSSDNCGLFDNDFGSITYDCLDIGNDTITITLTDNSGNESTSEVIIEVKDSFPPQIFCVMDFTVNVCDEVDYFEPITTDNCGAPMAELIAGLESGSSFPIGVTEIVFRATDAAGNSAECSFNITVEVDLDIDLEPRDASCFDFSDGKIAYEISGGTPPYQVNIDPVQQDTVTLHAGKYFITVEDAVGCAIIDSFDIGEPDILIIDNIDVVNETAALNDGSISISVTGGTPDYIFNWTKDGTFFSDNEDLESIPAGKYLCTVTDLKNCEFVTDTIEVQFETSIIDPDFNAQINLFPNPNDGSFVIELENDISALGITVFDPMGNKLVKEITSVVNNKIDLAYDLSPGLYVLLLNSDNKIAVRRFIVQE